jgi:hypothetical protein
VAGMQKDPEKQAASLWHLARAAALQGDGALPDTRRRELGATLDRVYLAYHGARGGLDELRAGAAAGAFPPVDYLVASAAAAGARRQQQELERTNPQLVMWLRIRKRLEDPDGEQYFAEILSAAQLPRLRGTLVRAAPAAKPVEIVLGMGDPSAEEVVLKLDAPFPHGAPAGTELEFEGQASFFTPEPFKLIINVARDQVEGWPERKAGR